MSEPKFGEWRAASVAPCGEYFLVRDGQGSHGIATRAYNDNWSYYFGGGNPTHWTPLPAPPKEEWEEAWHEWRKHQHHHTDCMTSFQAGFQYGRKK